MEDKKQEEYLPSPSHRGFPGGSGGKAPACNARDSGSSLHQEDPLEKGMAIHSSILSWRIPWTEEPGGLQFIGLQRVHTTKATQDTYKRHSREKTSLVDSSRVERETTEDDFVSFGLTS